MRIFVLYIFLFTLLGVKLDNSLNLKIEIANNNPTITFDFGEQKNKKLLISLYTPMILAFPYQSNNNHYNPSNSATYYSTGKNAQMPSIRPGEEDYKPLISKELFSISDNLKLNLTFGVITKEDFQCPPTAAGVSGLIRGTNGFKNLENKLLLINQLYDQKIISKRLFYLAPYYKDNNLLSELNLMIGSHPQELNVNELPYCDLDDTHNENHFDCRLDGVIIDDSDNAVSRHIKIKDKHIIARFEEGGIQMNILPNYLYSDFKEILVNKKGCKEINSTFDCSGVSEAVKNFKISYVFGKYKYTFNTASIWNNNKFFFKFDYNKDEENIIIVFSTFSGNFHRIYNMDDKRIYFSGFNNHIVKLEDNEENNKDDNVKIWKILFLISIIVLVVVIIVFVIIIITRKNHNSDLQNIAKVCFKDETEDNNQKNLLTDE